MYFHPEWPSLPVQCGPAHVHPHAMRISVHQSRETQVFMSVRYKIRVRGEEKYFTASAIVQWWPICWEESWILYTEYIRHTMYNWGKPNQAQSSTKVWIKVNQSKTDLISDFQYSGLILSDFATLSYFFAISLSTMYQKSELCICFFPCFWLCDILHSDGRETHTYIVSCVFERAYTVCKFWLVHWGRFGWISIILSARSWANTSAQSCSRMMLIFFCDPLKVPAVDRRCLKKMCEPSRHSNAGMRAQPTWDCLG